MKAEREKRLFKVQAVNNIIMITSYNIIMITSYNIIVISNV